jgi:hypothetical protein
MGILFSRIRRVRPDQTLTTENVRRLPVSIPNARQESTTLPTGSTTLTTSNIRLPVYSSEERATISTLTTSNTRKYGLSGKKSSTNSSLSSVSGITPSPIPSTLSSFTPPSSAPSTQSSSAISSIRTLTSNGKSKKSQK